MTEVSVDLDNRDKNSALFRLFLAFPAIIFVNHRLPIERKAEA